MLERLYVLGTLLLHHNRRLFVFLITYNHIQCNVIFHRLIKPEGYWTIRLTFIKVENNDETLSCYANRIRTDLNIDEFTTFFDIQTDKSSTSIKNIFTTFYRSFNNQIPDNIEHLNNEQRALMGNYITHQEQGDAQNRIYLFDIRHTGNRSEYNNDKAVARYPEIYAHFQHDTDYSFYFSENPADEVTLNQLLRKLRNRGYLG